MQYTVHGQVTTPGGVVSASKAYTADGSSSHEVTIADGASDQVVLLPIDSSQIKVFYMHSDQDVTVETPVDSAVILKANVPYLWTVDSIDAFIFYGETDRLLVSNSSGSSATFFVEQLYDSSL